MSSPTAPRGPRAAGSGGATRGSPPPPARFPHLRGLVSTGQWGGLPGVWPGAALTPPGRGFRSWSLLLGCAASPQHRPPAPVSSAVKGLSDGRSWGSARTEAPEALSPASEGAERSGWCPRAAAPHPHSGRPPLWPGALLLLKPLSLTREGSRGGGADTAGPADLVCAGSGAGSWPGWAGCPHRPPATVASSSARTTPRSPPPSAFLVLSGATLSGDSPEVSTLRPPRPFQFLNPRDKQE